MLASLLHFLSDGFKQILSTLGSMSPDMRAPIAIALGAIPGALSRYYLTILFAKWLGTSFPYGTFVVNITGALLMGLFTTVAVERHSIAPELSLLVATGFLGSYTTFSTYALDTSRLLGQGSYGYGLFYWIGSAMLGLVGLEIGSAIARRLL